MAADKRKWTVGPNVISEPSFDVVLRGYHRHDVDKYSKLVEQQLTSLVTETQDANAQIRILTDQLHRARKDLAESQRQLPAEDESLRFRHLGLRVEQILGLAEEQSEAIIRAAIEQSNSLREDAQRLHDQSRERIAQATRDFDVALVARRTEVEREIADKYREVTDESTRVAAMSKRMRAEAETALYAAREEAQHTTQAALAAAEGVRATAERAAQARWNKTEEQAAALASAAEEYAQQSRLAADNHARQVRDAAERHGAQARMAAEESAAEMLAHAEQLAAEIRTGSERHAERLRAAAPKLTPNEGPSGSPDSLDAAPDQSAKPDNERRPANDRAANNRKAPAERTAPHQLPEL